MLPIVLCPWCLFQILILGVVVLPILAFLGKFCKISSPADEENGAYNHHNNCGSGHDITPFILDLYLTHFYFAKGFTNHSHNIPFWGLTVSVTYVASASSRTNSLSDFTLASKIAPIKQATKLPRPITMSAEMGYPS